MSTLVTFFATLQAAGDAVVDVELVAEPSMLELMDRITIGAVDAMTRMGLGSDAAALLVVQSDTVAAADEIDRCATSCAGAGATYVAQTADCEEGEQFLAARRAALPALERLGTTPLDDIAVPKPAFPEMLNRIAFIADRRGVVNVVLFFWDPLEPQPHDPDVGALLRSAVVWNIPTACNRATADYLISSPLLNSDYDRFLPDYSASASAAVEGTKPSSRRAAS